MQIINTRNAAITHGIKALIYAKSGYGKTYLASTAPSPIILSAESGVLSLREFDLPMINIKTIKDLYDVYTWAISSHEAKQFETLYLDSLTEIGEVVLANAKNQSKDPRQAYGKLLDDMIPLIKSYRDIPNKHVIMTAKQEMNKDELSGLISNGPMMPGSKMGQQLPYLFDEVFRLGVGETEQKVKYRYIQTVPDSQYEAKDRSGVLDPIERPDLKFIINKILTKTKE